MEKNEPDQPQPAAAPADEPQAETLEMSPFERIAADAARIASGVTTRGRRTPLTAEQVAQIKALRGTAGVTRIAREFHIGPGRVRELWGEGVAPAPEEAIRSSPHFVAPEPPIPVAADLGSVVRRRKKGKPPQKPPRKKKGRGKKEEIQSSESETDEESREDVCGRFMQGLAAFRAGCDDRSMVKNLKDDLGNLWRSREISKLEYRRLRQEISSPRHPSTDDASPPPEPDLPAERGREKTNPLPKDLLPGGRAVRPVRPDGHAGGHQPLYPDSAGGSGPSDPLHPEASGRGEEVKAPLAGILAQLKAKNARRD